MKKPTTVFVLLLALALLFTSGDVVAMGKKNRKKEDVKDPYAGIVFPPPPAKGRIKLEKVIAGRADVLTKSRFKRKLLASSPQAVYDDLKRPFAVAIDAGGRFLVTDSMTQALIRFDITERKMDVFGTTGPYSLVYPLGVHVASDGTIYVADGKGAKVVAYDDSGEVRSVFGNTGELVNPADVTTSPDGTQLVVADSMGQRILVFDLENGKLVKSFGEQGSDDGQFNFPAALDFGPEGNLFVVDGQGARVLVFDEDFEFIDQFGERGGGYGHFTRPKDIVVDELGLIYVTDFAFNNVQLFDIDFKMLTFVGSGGTDPGRFSGASGIDVRGDTIAVVDQLGGRLQIFRFVVPKDE